MSFGQERCNTPQGTSQHLDSGLGFGSLHDPLSGSFELGEGCRDPHNFVEVNDWDNENGEFLDQAYGSLPEEHQPESLPQQPLSLFPQNELESSSNVKNDKSTSDGASNTDTTGSPTSTSTVTVDLSLAANGANASATSVTVDIDQSSDNSDVDGDGVPQLTHGKQLNRSSSQDSTNCDTGSVDSDVHSDRTNHLDATQTQTDVDDPSPSLVLSNASAQAVLIKEIVIRGSVVDDRPELVSERVLVEHVPSPVS